MSEPCRFVQLFDRVVDLQQGVVTGQGEDVRLGTKELRLLEHLVQAGVPVSRDDLLKYVWGVSAQVDTRTIETTVRRLRTKIEVDPNAPRHVITEHGMGYRFVAVETPKVDLPRPSPDGLIGRDREFVEVVDRLSAGQFLTLTGPGGVGKTRLATEILRQNRGRSEFFDLSPCRSRTDLLARVAEGVGVSLHQDELASIQCLGRAFRVMGPAMVVFDNFEQLTADGSDILKIWRDMAPALAILVTSRERVGLSGEVVFEVGPLSRDASARLFRERALASGVALEALKEGDITALCERLDGLPLAIELAAARVRTLGTARMADPTQGLLGLLTRRFRDAPDRQATLRGALDWSWGLLSPIEQRGLALCSLFSGGFSLGELEAVSDDPGMEAVLEELVDQSLVRVLEPSAEEVRFGLYFCVREYAQERWAEAPDSGTEFRFVRYFADFAWAEAQASETPRGPVALANLQKERLNLEEAFERSPTVAPALCGRLGWALLRWSRFGGSWHAESARVKRVVEEYPSLPVEAVAWLQAGLLLHFDADFSKYLRRAQEVQDLALSIGDRELAIRAAVHRGAALGASGQFEEGIAVLEAAAVEAEGTGSRLSTFARVYLATAVFFSGDAPRALQAIDREIPALRAGGSPQLRANALVLRGQALGALGRGAEAMGAFEEAEQIHLSFPVSIDLAHLYMSMAGAWSDGLCALQQVYPDGVEAWPLPAASIDKVLDYCDRAQALYGRHGASTGHLAIVELVKLDVVALDDRSPERFSPLDALYELYGGRDVPGIPAMALQTLVRALWRQGRPQEAIALYRSAPPEALQIDLRWRIDGAVEMMHMALAACFAMTGDAAGAKQHLEFPLPEDDFLRRAHELTEAIVAVHLGEAGAVELAHRRLAEHSAQVGLSAHVRRTAIALLEQLNRP